MNPIFEIKKLNDELIDANTKIIHLNATIAHLLQALELTRKRLSLRDTALAELKETIDDIYFQYGEE